MKRWASDRYSSQKTEEKSEEEIFYLIDRRKSPNIAFQSSFINN